MHYFLRRVRDALSSAGLVCCAVSSRAVVWCVVLLQDAHGRWRLQISAGGLVSALMGVNNYSTLWIGWPGGFGVGGGVPGAKQSKIKR